MVTTSEHTPHSWFIHDVDLGGRRADVVLGGGAIREVAPVGTRSARPRELRVDGGGGALLPGLHDHHLHLLATAASDRSVDVSPESTPDPDVLRHRLRRSWSAAPGDWVRATGYHESTAGHLDRHALDALVPGAPIRVQHRSGALWVLSTPGLQLLTDALHGGAHLGALAGEGIEMADGTPTGRLWRRDDLLRRLPEGPPDLAPLGRRLAALGITGVTDATPTMGAGALLHIEQSQSRGELPHVQVLGAANHATPEGGWCSDSCPRPHVHLSRGPTKLVVTDHQLPSFAELTGRIDEAHSAGRPVAVHVVTRAGLALTVAALEEVGTVAGDRVEHAAVTPPDLARALAHLKIRVVTQPSFIRLRGRDYLRDCEPEDLPHLYPWASLAEGGVVCASSSDAPYGDLDPWASARDARDRLTNHGRRVGDDAGVTTARALRSLLSRLSDPGGQERAVRVGAAADLVLLSAGWHEALTDPRAENVRQTWVSGRSVFERQSEDAAVGR